MPSRSAVRRRDRVRVGAAVLAGTVLLVGCGKTIDDSKVESAIQKTVKDQTGEDVTVDCPADQKAKAGDTFECAVQQGGQTLSAKVTQTDDNGTVTFVING